MSPGQRAHSTGMNGHDFLGDWFNRAAVHSRTCYNRGGAQWHGVERPGPRRFLQTLAMLKLPAFDLVGLAVMGFGILLLTALASIH